VTALKWEADEWQGVETATARRGRASSTIRSRSRAVPTPGSSRALRGGTSARGYAAALSGDLSAEFSLGQQAAPRVSRARLRRTGPVHPLRCALLYTGVPVFLLVVYVALWTIAMRAGYQKQQLSTQIARLRVENDSLQAKVREAQSYHRIKSLATDVLGMQRPEQVDYLVVGPAPAASVRAPLASAPKRSATSERSVRR
jgi:cell division protein FtsL